MPVVRRLLRASILGALAVGLVVPATAARAEPSRENLEQQIDKFSNELEHVVENYNRVTEELKTTQASIDDLNTKSGPLLASLDAARSNVDRIAARAYKGGGGLSTMAVLLSDGSTSNNLMSELNSLNQIARAQQRDIAEFNRIKAQHDEQRKKLDELRGKQTADQKTLSEQKTKIEGEVAKLMEMRKRAFGNPVKTVPAHTGPVPNIGGGAGAAVRFAYSVIGAPYVFGAEGPGYDCSGLTKMAWKAGGKNLPHNAAMQWNVVAHISRNELAEGDLVFYNGLGHVGLYVGGGQIIHASRPGVPVQKASVDMMRPYGYGRVR